MQVHASSFHYIPFDTLQATYLDWAHVVDIFALHDDNVDKLLWINKNRFGIK